MASLAKEPEVSVAERLGLTGEPHATAGLMERRRTDRRVQLEVVLAYIFCSLECPITDIAFPQWAPKDGTFGPLTCANPVPGNPDFVTRKVISGHEVCFAVLCAAVNRAQWGVLRYLEGAESKEADVWRQQDYRTAQLVLVLADGGKPNPYSKAFFQLFGKHAHQIRFWWRDRQKLYRLCELGGSNTPLLHSDLAYRYQDALVPDFDYSQVSPAHCPARPDESPAHAPGRRTVPRSSLVQAVSGVGQGNQVSSGGAHAEREHGNRVGSNPDIAHRESTPPVDATRTVHSLSKEDVCVCSRSSSSADKALTASQSGPLEKASPAAWCRLDPGLVSQKPKAANALLGSGVRETQQGNQVSSGGAHAERNRAALKGGQLPPAACTASQSGPLEKVSSGGGIQASTLTSTNPVPLERTSPVLPPPHVHAQPANRPAPSRAGAGFPKSRRTA